MTQPRQNIDLDTVGSDSFLDVVANLVGILIIMVVLVGVRIRFSADDTSPEPAEDPAAVAARAESKTLLEKLKSAVKERQSVEQEALETAGLVTQVGRQTDVARAERQRAALLAEQMRRAIAARRDQSAADQQQTAELQASLSAAEQKLAELNSKLQQVGAQRPTTITLLDYPTPISQTVHGDEIHFQLRAGRVALAPVEALVERIRAQSQQLIWKLRDQPEVNGTVGPIDGFRMKYTFEKLSAPLESVGIGREARAVGGGSYAALKEFVMVPESYELGEPLADALGNHSRFRSLISARDPTRVTITLWIYPDSFEAFRQIRAELYRLGYAVAARPLPDGAPISGSPHGSKSVAQ